MSNNPDCTRNITAFGCLVEAPVLTHLPKSPSPCCAHRAWAEQLCHSRAAHAARASVTNTAFAVRNLSCRHRPLVSSVSCRSGTAHARQAYLFLNLSRGCCSLRTSTRDTDLLQHLQKGKKKKKKPHIAPLEHPCHPQPLFRRQPFPRRDGHARFLQVQGFLCCPAAAVLQSSLWQ